MNGCQLKTTCTGLDVQSWLKRSKDLHPSNVSKAFLCIEADICFFRLVVEHKKKQYVDDLMN